MRPRLLVSVRNASEAARALEGGANVIDVKEPAHGPLGRATLEVLVECMAWRNSLPESIRPPVSAALGELVDLPAELLLPTGLTWVKSGLSGFHGNQEDWWRSHASVLTKHPATNVVAVIYADSEQTPPWQEIVAWSAHPRCAGVLIDTVKKDGSTLLDHFSLSTLETLANSVHAQGRFLALAGSLRREQLGRLAALQPDVLAIRGAACVGHNRDAAVSVAAVQEFRRELCRVWSLPPAVFEPGIAVTAPSELNQQTLAATNSE